MQDVLDFTTTLLATQEVTTQSYFISQHKLKLKGRKKSGCESKKIALWHDTEMRNVKKFHQSKEPN